MNRRRLIFSLVLAGIIICVFLVVICVVWRTINGWEIEWLKGMTDENIKDYRVPINIAIFFRTLLYIVIIGILGRIFVAVICMLNSMVNKNESVNIAYAKILSVLQRRGDLITNLVTVVKGYAAHEEEIFIRVADARSKLSGAISKGVSAETHVANAELTFALGRLLVIQENYPNLKADTQFTALRNELTGTENEINSARQGYCDGVAAYNQFVLAFPNILIAFLLEFSAREYPKVEEYANVVPQVEFKNENA